MSCVNTFFRADNSFAVREIKWTSVCGARVLLFLYSVIATLLFFTFQLLTMPAKSSTLADASQTTTTPFSKPPFKRTTRMPTSPSKRLRQKNSRKKNLAEQLRIKNQVNQLQRRITMKRRIPSNIIQLHRWKDAKLPKVTFFMEHTQYFLNSYQVDERFIVAYACTPDNEVAFSGTMFRSPISRTHPEYRAWTTSLRNGHALTALRRLHQSPRILEEPRVVNTDGKVRVVTSRAAWPNLHNDTSFSSNVIVNALKNQLEDPTPRDQLERRIRDTVFIRDNKIDLNDANEYSAVRVRGKNLDNPNTFWSNNTFPEENLVNKRAIYTPVTYNASRTTTATTSPNSTPTKSP